MRSAQPALCQRRIELRRRDNEMLLVGGVIGADGEEQVRVLGSRRHVELGRNGTGDFRCGLEGCSAETCLAVETIESSLRCYVEGALVKRAEPA